MNVFWVTSIMSNSLWPPWAVALQVPQSMGFPRWQHWSGLPFTSPGDLPHPGIKPRSLALAGRFFIVEPTGYTETNFSSVVTLIENTIWETAYILLANIPWHLLTAHFQAYVKKLQNFTEAHKVWKSQVLLGRCSDIKTSLTANSEQFKLKTNMEISNVSLSCI